jgi:hypothetical protein
LKYYSTFDISTQQYGGNAEPSLRDSVPYHPL